jgi:hypothetical protein
MILLTKKKIISEYILKYGKIPFREADYLEYELYNFWIRFYEEIILANVIIELSRSGIVLSKINLFLHKEFNKV